MNEKFCSHILFQIFAYLLQLITFIQWILQRTYRICSVVARSRTQLSNWTELNWLSVVLVAQLCLTLCDPMDNSLTDSSLHGISRQEYWSGLPFPSPGNLSNPGIEPGSPALQADSLPSEPPGKTYSAWGTESGAREANVNKTEKHRTYSL